MKNIHLSLLFLSVFFLFHQNIAEAQRVKGNGHVIDKGMAIKNFDAIEVGSAFSVELMQSGKQFVSIETDENIMPYVEVEVEDGKLSIYFAKGVNIRKTTTLKAKIGFNKLNYIGLTSAAELKGKGKMNFDELKIETSGASKIDLKLSAGKLAIESSGAGNIKLAGNADEFTIDLSGASNLQAYDLTAKDCKIDVAGASNAKVFATKTMHATAAGASAILYKGDPASIEIDATEASSVKKR